MAGANPYIKPVQLKLPDKPYKIRFISEETKEETVVEVNPGELPYDNMGVPGSILDTAMENGIELDHSCGGVVACSTCHVIVKQGFDTCNEKTDDEEDMLDSAPGLTPESRLGCQCVPDGSTDVVVQIPAWNRNAVKEGHH